jgi:hypothetical protein
MPGMLYAALVHSTIARGRIASIDTSQRRSRAGRRIGDDVQQRAADEGARRFLDRDKASAGSDLPIMQDETDPLERRIRSRWCSPRRRNRPIMPGRWSRSPMRRSRGHLLRLGQGHAHRRNRSWASPRRCSRSAMPRPRWPRRVQRRSRLHHAAPQPQCDRAARRDLRVGRRTLTIHDATQLRHLDRADRGGHIRPRARARCG